MITKANGDEVGHILYDGDGRRVKRITPEGTTVTVGGHYEVFYPTAPDQTVTAPGVNCPDWYKHTPPRLAVDANANRHLVYGNYGQLCYFRIEPTGQVTGSVKTGGLYSWNHDVFDVSADASGTAYVLWRKWGTQQELRLTPIISNVWQADVVIRAGSIQPADGTLAVEDDGTAHVVWIEDGALYYAQVSGGTVTTQTLATADAAAPGIALDGSGVAHVAWRQSQEEGYAILYTPAGGDPETVSDETCAVSGAARPALDIDSGGWVHVAWGARDASQINSSGPVCYAMRDPAGGAWTRVDTGRLAQGDRLVLEVVGGTVYLMRGVRAWLQNGDDKNGLGNYDQEIITLDRYQAGVWDALLGNTYPTQDDEGNSYDGQHISILDGDIALDANENAYLAWIDNGEAWDTQNTSPRLRTTTVVSTTAAPQVTKHYYADPLVGAGGQRIATRVDEDLYYVLGDHLGSTSLVTDDQGNEVGHVIYDAYGSIVTNTLPATLTDRLFTGQIFDASTGLYYYNARYYDPFAGQFTQPDSLVANPLNPAAWNRFSYVRNSPTNYVDPSGHFPWVPLIVAGLIGGGLNVTAGYLTSDQYSTTQGLTDFAIGAAFGMAVYGVGAYFVPEFIGVSASTHFIGRATWGQAMTTLRVTTLVELNVLESVVAASVDDREYTSNDLASALFWGLFGAGVGEVLGYMTGRVTRELRFSRETYHELGRSYQRYARQWRNLLPDNSAKPRVLQATASYLRWSATQRARSAIPRFVRPFMRDAFPIAQWRTFAFLITTTLGDPELLGALAPATPFEDPVLLNR